MDSNRTKLQPEGFFSRKLKTVINNDADGDFRINVPPEGCGKTGGA